MAFCCLLSAVIILLCYTGKYSFRAQAEESQAAYPVPEVQAGIQVYLNKGIIQLSEPQKPQIQDEISTVQAGEDPVQENDMLIQNAFCRQAAMIGSKPSVKREQVSTSAIHLNPSDYECLLKIVESEAGICDRKGKILVANVVLNRMNSSCFPDTVTEVVYQKNQFSPVENGSIDQVTVSDETREAVSMALSGTDYSQGALFFAARKLAKEKNMEWFDSSLKYLFEHDGHEFFTLK